MAPDEVKVIVERLDNLIKKQDADEKTALMWRIRFMDKLDARPCEMHSGMFKSVALQLKGIWVIIGAIIITVITEFIKRR